MNSTPSAPSAGSVTIDLPLPKYIVINITEPMKALHHIVLTDDRGYEEMVRQVFDYLGDSTPDNDLLHKEFVPHITLSMVRGISNINTIADQQEVQSCFAFLYAGIVKELLRLGFDQMVHAVGHFPYILDRLRGQNQVVLTYADHFPYPT